MVNDYKLPTFEARVTDVKRSNNPDSLITVTCMAESYSGFPVSNAQVKVRLEAVNQIFWRGAVDGITFWTSEANTDKDGTITVNINKDIIALNPIFQSRLNIVFDITSAAGETHSCDRVISTGKPYIISTQSNVEINLDDNPSLKADVWDANGNEAKIPLKYTFVKEDSVDVASFTTGESFPTNVPVGYYEVKIAPVDTSLAETTVAKSVLLYKNTGPSPVGQLLFVPVHNFTAQDNHLNILMGCNSKVENILVATLVDGKMQSREWYKPSKGMQYYKVNVPEESHEIEVKFITVYNNRQEVESVKIINCRVKKELKIEVESFRDKIVPGTPEKITVKVKENGNGVPASVIMRMESKSILALRDNYLKLNIPEVYYPSMRIMSRNNYLYGSVSSMVKNLTWPSIPQPELETYGLNFTTFAQRKLRNLSAARSTTTSDNGLTVVYETAEEVAYDAAAPMFSEKKVMAANGAVTGSVETIEEEAEAGEEQTQAPEKDNYRPSEIPLAFFAPLLQTEADGSLTYTYIVPDANTTWVMKALAYTPDMLTSTVERTTTASRPVMVQSNAPRFLRYGDSVTLRATVMNNITDAVLSKSVISILDADSMQELASETIENNLNGNESTVITLPFTAPSTGQAVILRVKSTAGEYTDGEQVLIPLLPASQPVITSRSFFMPASKTDTVFTLEKLGNGGITTLYMYDNPLWEVITALPALNDEGMVTSTGAMNAIYMASVARGIMSKNPSLKEGLSAWLESDRADSTLTSMLSRNDQLKQLALNATPWVREAMSDRERLTSLALMLDDKHLDNIINKAVKVLDFCQLKDGGLSWCQDGKYASSWSTYRVLTLAASLQQRGYMPGNSKLGSIINSAVSYIDNQVAERLKKEKHPGDFTQYAYIRSILKNANMAKKSDRAIQLTVNNILKRWKKESTIEKGIDAIILYRNGYPSMARQIVASIKSFSMTSPEKGTWWDRTNTDIVAALLYTIETVTPDDTELIESVAQWLIMNKTNQAWGNAVSTAATIDALLGAIDVNKAINGSTNVTVNGFAVNNSTVQIPGMTVAEIEASDKQGITLEINKTTGLPAMGSVINRSILSMNEIKASVHPSISIEKRYNVIKGTETVASDTFTVGDRVHIQLVLTVNDDLDYVTIVDRRSACMEPVEQLSGYSSDDALWFYREMTDSETRYFIESLPRGTYVIDADINIMAEGTFSSGVATVQSQLNPGVTANSSSSPVTVLYK
ncbi:MAG: hypothetical protein K2G40_05185 [Muribaculaceae bacterium]|nr:hypothetical protein [Muribaculaceae bacterium]